MAYTGEVFGSFDKLYEEFGKANEISSTFITRSYRIPELKVSVACINTAMLSGAGLTTDIADDRALAFPEIAIARALKAMPDDDLKIIVGHHPFHFLNEANQTVMRTIVQKGGDMYLSGHLHAAQPEFVTAPQGRTSLIQAGSLYAWRESWNGYSVVSVSQDEPLHHRVTYRRWHEARREFGLASEFSDAGEVFSSPEAQAHWALIRPKLDLSRLETWRVSSLIQHALDECSKDASKVFESGRFIEPDFERDNYVTTESGVEKTAQPEALSYQDVMKLNKNLVIFASGESGKTTLIREWARILSCRSAASASWTIPVILRYAELKNYTARIERLVRQRLPAMPDGITHVDLLESGLLTIFVDDAVMNSSALKSGFDEFVKLYPKNKFILLTSSVYLQGAGIAPVVVEGVEFEHIRLKQLKTSQLLTLIESHGTRDPVEADRLLQRMVQEAMSLNVPITPVTGTFLIQIYTEDSSTTLVNKANLVERYIEISLEKFAPADLLPSTFDYHNKSDLLSAVASRMTYANIDEVSEDECLRWIEAYLHEYGLKFSTIDLLNYFVQARVLERADGQIAFRLNAFLEYFAASRMIEDSEFREHVLSAENYLRYANEISFYAAISRRDKAWMEELYKRFKDTSAKVWKGNPDYTSASDVMENFVLPASSDGAAELQAIEDRVFNGHISEEDRREALDDDLPAAQAGNKVRGRENIVDPGHQWVAQLTMLSAMLKNMELVPSKLKTEILAEVVEGWLQFISMSMGIVPKLAIDRRLKFAGIDYIVIFPKNMDSGELARRLLLYMPISSAKIANFHLGTEKLRIQLEAGIGEGDDAASPAAQFFRAAILAQLGVDDLGEVLKKVSVALHGKRYLQEVFYRLLAEVVIRYRLPDDQIHKIKVVAADLMVTLEGKNGNKAVSRRNEVIKSLDSSRLRVQMKTKGHAMIPSR